MQAFLDVVINFIFLTAEPLAHLGTWGYLAMFLIAFIESVIVLGSFIPGSVGIIFAGFLAAHGYYNFWGMLLVGALGGIVGDALSYYLGKRGERFFGENSRFLKKSLLDKGKLFFQKFGDKSILLGRFTGPLRPVMPFIAGLSEMDKRKFSFWNVSSAFIWVTFHLSLGFLFASSLGAIEKWSLMAGALLLIFVAFVVGFALLIEYRDKIFSYLSKKSNSLFTAILLNTYLGQFLNDNPKLEKFLVNRFHRGKFSGLPLTVLITLFFYMAFLLGDIVEDFIKTNSVSFLDEKVLSLANSFYHPNLVKWTILFTDLGGEIVIPVVAGFVVLFLLFKNRKFILPFLFTGISAEIFNLAGKNFFERVRPAGELVNETSYSFPSGHATLSIAVYGFLVYLIFKLSKKENLKIWSLVVMSVFIGLIGLSRLYLQVHYLSDVLGGFVLGGLCLVAGIIFSEYLLNKNKNL